MKPLSTLNDEGLSDALHRSRGLRDAPEAAIERAIHVFQPRAGRSSPSSPSPLPALLRRVWAGLAFDSAGALLPAHGLRSTGTAARQVLFSAEGRDIDLRIVPVAGHAPHEGGPWVIFGQVLGPDHEGRAELSHGDQVYETALDDMLEFRFDQVPGGSVRLSLYLKDLVIDLTLDVPLPQAP